MKSAAAYDVESALLSSRRIKQAKLSQVENEITELKAKLADREHEKNKLVTQIQNLWDGVQNVRQFR